MRQHQSDDNINFYCYSCELFHFLSAFHEKCYTSKINTHSQNRYWVFHKSERLDKLIELYNETKIIVSGIK